MKETTKKWLEFAKGDLAAANVQFQHGQRLGHAYQIVVFLCHQTVEKTLKALIVEADAQAIKTHDLTRLRKETGVAMPENIVAAIDELNPHYLQSRYPDLPFSPSFSYTYNRKNTERLINETKNVFIWLEKKLASNK